MKIYTRKGDDGTTGLLFGGRVRKDGPGADRVRRGRRGTGRARRGAGRVRAGSELDAMLVGLERDSVGPDGGAGDGPGQPDRSSPAGKNLVTNDMVAALEASIDDAVDSLRSADRVRRAGRDARRRTARRGPYRRPPRRAARARRGARTTRTPCRTSTACPTCCGRWPAGRKERRCHPGRISDLVRPRP